jgi:hypothetical protein
MRIAVCFSGVIRTGVLCVDNIKRFLGDMLPNCDFFLHTWDYETNKPFARTHWNDIPFIQRLDEPLRQEKLQKFIEAYNPIKFKVDSYSEFMNSVTNKQFPIVWHTLSRSFELKRQHELENNFTYDVVIKIRPDVIFPDYKSLRKALARIDISKPVIYSDPHIAHRLDDVFWITNSQVADTMIRLVAEPRMPPDNFNTAVVEFIRNNGISHLPIAGIDQICYTIYRYESYMLDPMTNFRECYMNDLIHYSSVPAEEIQGVFRYNDKNNLYRTVK